jgi:RsiW-degrading membrane proteinase PrsW (M82 family)
MTLKTTWLLLAIAGTLLPYWFFVDFIINEGFDPVRFVVVLFANGSVAGFTADLLISSLVFWIYMFSRRQQGPNPAPFVLLNLCIGLSCALPAYLWASIPKSESP